MLKGWLAHVLLLYAKELAGISKWESGMFGRLPCHARRKSLHTEPDVLSCLPFVGP